MPSSEAGRYQEVHGLADQLAPRVAKQPFGCDVGQQDEAVAVDHQHRARRVLDQRAKALLAGTQIAGQFPGKRFRLRTDFGAMGELGLGVAEMLPGLALVAVRAHRHHREEQQGVADDGQTQLLAWHRVRTRCAIGFRAEQHGLHAGVVHAADSEPHKRGSADLDVEVALAAIPGKAGQQHQRDQRDHDRYGE